MISELIVRTFVGDKIVLFPCYAETATYGEYQIRRNIPNSNYKHTSSDGKWSFRINNDYFNLLTFAIIERMYNTAGKNGTFMLILY